MKLKEIYTYLKSHHVSVWLDIEQHRILLGENESTLVDVSTAYLVPFVSDLVALGVKNTFRTSWDGYACTRKLRIEDLDEFIETYKRWYEIEEPERRNRYAALKKSYAQETAP